MNSRLRDYDHATFNRLPKVESAHRALVKGDQLTRAFSELGPVFFRHGVANEWGICLLHRHWPIEHDEVPLQNIRKSGTIVEYVSSPENVVSIRDCCPLVISMQSCRPGAFQPLEFSTDLTARRHFEVLVERPKFLKELWRRAKDAALDDMFGLIYRRKPDGPESQWLEVSLPNRTSVLREVNKRDCCGKGLIETAWVFDSLGSEMKCEGSCLQLCIDNGEEGHIDDGYAELHDPEGED